jgi:hypothetical protein
LGDLAFRRAPHVVTFWLRGEHLIFNYATGVVVRGSSLAMEVLDSLGKWKTWDTLSKSRSREERRLLRRLVDLMVRRTFVTRSDESRDIDQRLSAWRTWNPAAGFFHFATKDVRYRSEDGQTSVPAVTAKYRYGEGDGEPGAVGAGVGSPQKSIQPPQPGGVGGGWLRLAYAVAFAGSGMPTP